MRSGNSIYYFTFHRHNSLHTQDVDFSFLFYTCAQNTFVGTYKTNVNLRQAKLEFE